MEREDDYSREDYADYNRQLTEDVNAAAVRRDHAQSEADIEMKIRREQEDWEKWQRDRAAAARHTEKR